MQKPIVKITNNARLINLQERDMKNLELLARWWCITPEHMARSRMSEQEIKEIWEQNGEESEHKRGLLKRSERRRMTKLGTITPPFFTSGYAQNLGSVYWLTVHGARLTGAPFKKYPSGNITRAPHAWAVADIAMRLEREGFKTYSEREFSCGETVEREIIWDSSPTENPRHPGSGARPDLVLPCEDGKYIFIEVERKISGVRGYYEHKLNSYMANPAVSAIWYITDKKATATRLNNVYRAIAQNHVSKPFRILRMDTLENHYTSFTGWDRHEDSLRAELETLGACKQT